MAAEQLSDGPFAVVLRKRRADYNHRVAQAELNQPAFDRAALNTFLVDTAAPVLDVVAREAPHAIESVADSLFDTGIRLTERSLLGEKRRWAPLPGVLRKLAPAATPLLAIAPDLVLQSIANAVINVQREGGDGERWGALMSAAAVFAESLDQFRETGVVAAWASGLAALRTPALRIARKLPPRVVAPILQVKESQLAAQLEALEKDPWLRGDEPPRIARELGNHVGLGGQFVETPKLFHTPDGITVQSGKRWWHLHADRYGAQLIPSPPPLQAESEPSSRWSFEGNGTVTRDGSRSKFPYLANPAQVVLAEDLLLATSQLSFRIFLVV